MEGLTSYSRKGKKLKKSISLRLKALQDEFLANGGEYKTYRIGDLFIQTRGKEAAPNRVPDGEFYMINETSTNNGVTKLAHSKHITKGNAITVSVNYATTVFYQERDFCASVNILILKSEWLNREVGLYIASVLRKNNIRYNYTQKISRDRLNDTEIKLPTLPSGELAFDFMASLIRDLEEERISDLEVAERKTQDFRIDQLFTVQSSKKKFNANSLSFNGKYRYIARGSGNNGIRAYITEDTKYLNNAHTISFGQDTATMFYQDEPYFTGDKIKIMSSKGFILDEKLASYLITAMRLGFSTYSWGSSSFKESNLKETLISLPITEDGSIDYDYMESLIGAIQKQVIEKVVAYKDEVIAETKRIVHES